MIEVSDEFKLACACCRWPPSDSRNATVREAAKAVTDWARFLRLVKRHRIEGLVHAALQSADIQLPPDVAQQLAHDIRQIARQNVVLAGETVNLQKNFDQAGIPVLFFKGVALAQLAYGSLALKHGKDIDLLVSPDKADAALSMLEEQGYALWLPEESLDSGQRRAMFRYSMEAALIHRKTGIQVELHWALTDNPLLLRDVDTSSSTQQVALSVSQSVRTLSDENLFAYLCAHGAIHAWSRLKWLADVHAFIAGKSECDIERQYCQASAKGAGLCADQALLLCEKLLGWSPPSSLTMAYRPTTRMRLLVDIAMDAMAGGNGEAETWDRRFLSTRISLTRFLLGRGWRYFLVQCERFSIALHDVLNHTLPSHLHFLYPLLRVPLWLWRVMRNQGRSVLPPPLSGRIG